VMKGGSYSLASDIYSFGVIMAELSSGKLSFNNMEPHVSLSLTIHDRIRPEFKERTPEIYKELALKCMDANPSKRLEAKKLCKIFKFWYNCIIGNEEYAGNVLNGY